MRARNLKPAFFKNDLLAELPTEGRLLFAGLWCLADREGRLEDRPKRIKGEIFPFDSFEVDDLLCGLAKFGFISRYSVGGGNYIQIRNFLKHQHPHHLEAQSSIPAPVNFGNAIIRVLDDDKILNSTPDDHTLNPRFTHQHQSSNPRIAPVESQIHPPFQDGQIGLNPESFNLNPDNKPLGQNASEYSTDFITFWLEYPKKVGKGAAWKSWKKTRPSLTECLVALAWQKKSQQWTKDQGEFIPNPSTWLNQRRWEDEKPRDQFETWASEG